MVAVEGTQDDCGGVGMEEDVVVELIPGGLRVEWQCSSCQDSGRFKDHLIQDATTLKRIKELANVLSRNKQ